MNRRGIVLLFLSVLAAVPLQAAVLPLFVDTLFRPDLLLVVMVFLALRLPYGSGMPAAWFLGLLKDAFSGLFLGLNAFSFLIVFLVIKSLASRLYAESGSLFVITVGAATVAGVGINLLLVVMFTKSSTIAYSMFYGLLPHLLFNAFCASLAALLPLFPPRGEVA